MSLMGKLKALAVLAVATEAIYAVPAVTAAAHHAGHLAVSAAAPAALAGTPGSNEALANRMAASGYGWRGAQIACLDDLWIHESGFRSDAVNASSGATGIPQLLPSVHQVPANWSDPRTQIRWGLAYVHGKYGTPCAAWNFEMSHTPNWY